MNSSKNLLINYLEDGTFEMIADSELAEIVGGVASASEPTNSGYSLADVNIICKQNSI